jgi:hypothetical protein
MFVTDEQAAQMYARACRSWYGVRALSVVNSQIERQRAKADKKGVAAWERVASHLEDPTGLLIVRLSWCVSDISDILG